MGIPPSHWEEWPTVPRSTVTSCVSWRFMKWICLIPSHEKLMCLLVLKEASYWQKKQRMTLADVMVFHIFKVMTILLQMSCTWTRSCNIEANSSLLHKWFAPKRKWHTSFHFTQEPPANLPLLFPSLALSRFCDWQNIFHGNNLLFAFPRLLVW